MSKKPTAPTTPTKDEEAPAPAIKKRSKPVPTADLDSDDPVENARGRVRPPAQIRLEFRQTADQAKAPVLTFKRRWPEESEDSLYFIRQLQQDRTLAYVAMTEATPIRLRAPWDKYDFCIHRPLTSFRFDKPGGPWGEFTIDPEEKPGWTVTCGMTGCRVASGGTKLDAIAAAHRRLAADLEELRPYPSVIAMMITYGHLSPRYTTDKPIPERYILNEPLDETEEEAIARAMSDADAEALDLHPRPRKPTKVEKTFPPMPEGPVDKKSAKAVEKLREAPAPVVTKKTKVGSAKVAAKKATKKAAAKKPGSKR